MEPAPGPDAFSALRRLLVHPRALAAWNPHGLRLQEAVLLELLERRAPATPRAARQLLELFAEPARWGDQPPENLAFLAGACEALRTQWVASQQPAEAEDPEVDPLETLRGVFIRRPFASAGTRVALEPVRAAPAADRAHLAKAVALLFRLGYPRASEREKVLWALHRGYPDQDLARLAHAGEGELPDAVYAESRRASPDLCALVGNLALADLREVLREFLERNELSTRPAARRIVELLTGRFPPSGLSPRRVEALWRASPTLQFWFDAAKTLSRGLALFEEELVADPGFEPGPLPKAPAPLPAGSPGVRGALDELKRHDVLRPAERELVERWVAREPLAPADHERRDFTGLLATLPVGRRLEAALLASARDAMPLAEARAIWTRVLDHHGFEPATVEVRRLAARADERFGGLGDHAAMLVSRLSGGETALHPYAGPALVAALLHGGLNRAGDLVVFSLALRDDQTLDPTHDPLLVRLRAPSDFVHVLELYRFARAGPRGRFELVVRSELHGRA